MSEALELKWADDNAKINKYGTKEYSPYICHIMNMFDKRVHDDEYCCQWESPYGFVAEAGCLKHD